MESIPFTMETAGGLGRVDGRLRLAQDETRHLILEYQTKDRIFGVLKSRPRSVRISLSEVESIRFVRRRIRASLVDLELSNLRLAERIPGSEMGRLKLHVKKPERDRAKRAVVKIQRELSQHRLLDDERPLTDAEVNMLFGDED